ncbi:hypothetical protein [Rhizobium ruizarguesonis]|uniref:hypothetical protein n=1 Tax=Rhizobium ruizarguesonis TaxID=2081791 RepID=UPI0013C0B30D|nr:hypothetical protein [Rhizobium ruizarguesonis]NEH28159.1 hypothetical protein [Rhizobium ruizarguesonis]NEK07477.1 hypothetical protein [Rhizobium ruizarguesonis]
MNDKQALTLEVGKAEIVGTTNLNKYYKFIGVIAGKNDAFGWKSNGENDPLNKVGDDLVAEWVELKRIKGWVNVYSGNDENYGNPHNIDSSQHCGHVYPKRAHADIAAVSLTGRNRIACIEIDVLEGAGLEGRSRNGILHHSCGARGSVCCGHTGGVQGA